MWIYQICSFQGGSAEIELKKGDTITLTTDKAFSEKGNKDMIYVDYSNITNVIKVNDRVYVDDGLISLVVKKVGKTVFFFVKYYSKSVERRFVNQRPLGNYYCIYYY